MEKEIKQTFVRRITQSNRTELIVILYEMADYYLQAAEKACQQEDWKDFQKQLGYAGDVITRLMKDLDFQYPIAGELYALYRYCLVELSMARIKRRQEETAHVKTVLDNLYPAMKGLMQIDHSEPLMAHTQQVVAGMTYHKANLTEVYQDPDASRGFLA